MERFDRECPTHGFVVVELFDVIPTDRWDEHREVQLLLQNGQRFRAGFWRDPQQRGGHWSEESGMFIVQDLTTSQIMAAVDEFLQQESLYEAFELCLDG